MPTDDAVARVLEETRRICAMPAPPFGEGPRGELVAWLFGESGVPARIDDAGTVIARLGAHGEHAVVFAAHLDTVFEAATEIRFCDLIDLREPAGDRTNSREEVALLHH